MQNIIIPNNVSGYCRFGSQNISLPESTSLVTTASVLGRAAQQPGIMLNVQHQILLGENFDKFGSYLPIFHPAKSLLQYFDSVVDTNFMSPHINTVLLQFF